MCVRVCVYVRDKYITGLNGIKEDDQHQSSTSFLSLEIVL